MNDRLDDMLSRLPVESHSPDLAARIALAVAQRCQARRTWRRVEMGILTSAAIGGLLVAFSWREAVQVLNAALSLTDTNAWLEAGLGLAVAPLDTLAAWLETSLAWWASPVDGLGITLLLGIALLSVAAFGGMADLLRSKPPKLAQG